MTRAQMIAKVTMLKRKLEELKQYKQVLHADGLRPDAEDKKRESELIQRLIGLEKDMERIDRARARGRPVEDGAAPPPVSGFEAKGRWPARKADDKASSPERRFEEKTQGHWRGDKKRQPRNSEGPRRDDTTRPPRRDSEAPRRDEKTQPPRRESGAQPPRRDSGTRPPRRDEKTQAPRRDAGTRPPRRDEKTRVSRHDEEKPAGRGGQAPRRDDKPRPPRRNDKTWSDTRDVDARSPGRGALPKLKPLPVVERDDTARRDDKSRPPRRGDKSKPPRRFGAKPGAPKGGGDAPAGKASDRPGSRKKRGKKRPPKA